MLSSTTLLVTARTIETSSEQSFSDAYDIGMGAVHRLSKGLLPNLRLARKKREDACFINIASMYGMVSPISIYKSKVDSNPLSMVRSKLLLFNIRDMLLPSLSPKASGQTPSHMARSPILRRTRISNF